MELLKRIKMYLLVSIVSVSVSFVVSIYILPSKTITNEIHQIQHQYQYQSQSQVTIIANTKDTTGSAKIDKYEYNIIPKWDWGKFSPVYVIDGNSPDLKKYLQNPIGITILTEHIPIKVHWWIISQPIQYKVRVTILYI